MATPIANGSANIDSTHPAPKVNTSHHQQGKASYGGKVVESGRKPLGGHDDSSQRRNPPKAWSTGMNPITQRANTPSQSNGTIIPTRNASHKSTTSQETMTPDRQTNDRLIRLLGTLLGLPVTLSMKNGELFSGIFAGATTDGQDPTYLLKMVRQIKTISKSTVNGTNDVAMEYIGIGPDHSMSFSMLDTVDILAENVLEATPLVSQDATPSAFRTDTDISGKVALRERNLQRWESPMDSGVDLSLESVGDRDWDQFKTNEQRFGVKSDYDENMYTTPIDKSNPLYAMREAEAERIAREIEGNTPNNAHMREERGIHQEDDGLDEEERYSGVRRNGNGQDYSPLQSNQPNKYTPPARRLPPAKPIETGSSLDPAIISSQIARPGNKPEESQAIPATSKPKAIEIPEKISETSRTTQSRQNVANKESGTKSTLPLLQGKLDGSSATVTTATENVEAELLDSFRHFSNIEKMKVQENRRNRASADKAIRINDLLKFSKSFKLLTPVPKDLVPILAKDKSKQDEIMEKAQRLAEQASSSSTRSTIRTEQKNQRPLAKAQWDAEPGVSSSETGHISRGRQGLASYNSQASQSSKDRQLPQIPPNQTSKSGQSFLSHRLQGIHGMHKAGVAVPVPAPLPIQDARVPPTKPSTQASSTNSPQKTNGVRSPTSALSAKFNVKALEFKPNPAASSFKPTTDPSVESSPRSSNVNTRPVSRAPSPSAFFGDRKPLPPSERPSIMANFNPLKFLKAEAQKENKPNEHISNGGIRHAYKTPPTWHPPKEGEEFKSYKDMFDVVPQVAHSTMTSQVSPGNPPLPHQHQLPLHLQTVGQGIPQVQAPHQVPHHLHAQPHHYPAGPHHYDDHHMRPSASSSSTYPSPSPRMNQMYIAHPSPMAQHAQLAYGQPIPQYYMNGPQPAGFRQFSGGPQMIASQGPHLAAPMMVQQPSGNGIMSMQQPMAIPFNPQIAMYPNGTSQSFGGPPQPPSGYPSPGRGAPMMMHQGSHQGQHPQLYMAPNQYGQPIYAQHQPVHMPPIRGYASPQPHYTQSPYPQHHYPHQPHRTPNNGYAQLPQAHHQHMGSQQGPPPQVASMDMMEEPKS